MFEQTGRLKMITAEYKLVKWLEDESFEELEVTIDPGAVNDFCEMMDWDEKQFANNTIRYPVVIEDDEDDDEVINSDQESPKEKPKKKVKDKRQDNSGRKVKQEYDPCPRCNSENTRSGGFRTTQKGRFQVVICRDCKRKFTEGADEKGRPKETTYSNARIDYTEKLTEFLKDNMKFSNDDIRDLVQNKLKVDMSSKQVADFFYTRGLGQTRKIAKKKYKEESSEEESNEKNIGDIIGVHLNRNDSYACNPGCSANPKKMSRDWKYINCKNCIRKFKNKSLPINNPPERSNSGRIITGKKQLFSEAIQDFIEENYITKTNSELRILIGEKFGKWYTMPQIKDFLKKEGWSRSTKEPAQDDDDEDESYEIEEGLDDD